jgi:hypothetical protein
MPRMPGWVWLIIATGMLLVGISVLLDLWRNP